MDHLGVDTRESVRTFRAATPRAALAAVKAALGAEAVIHSCHEVESRFLGRSEIEVVASAPSATSATPDPRGTGTKGAPPDTRRTSAPAVAVASSMVTASNTPTRNDASPQDAYRIAQAARLFGFIAEPSAPFSAPSPVSDSPIKRRPKPRTARRGKTATVEEELANVEAKEHVANILQHRGVERELTMSLLEGCSTSDGDPTALITDLRRAWVERLSFARAPWQPDPTRERSVIALVGPTGSGKTTTVAKIAALAALEFRARVLMLTLDVHRVGAAEQLIRYGQLMGIRTESVATREGFLRAIDSADDADLVVIDTAGRSPSDHEVIAQQTAILRLVPTIERYLVVPAMASSQHARRIQERYFPMTPERLIVTKADEAEGAGSVLHVATRLGLPISCYTDGQRVPDDIRRVNPSILLAAIDDIRG
jgi:flagellar biosynthesis protein FlhF